MSTLKSKKLPVLLTFLMLGILAVTIIAVPYIDKLNTDTRSDASETVQLLKDQSFYNGVTVGYGNTYKSDLDAPCVNNWKSKMPTYDSAKWMFWEVSERFYFCDNPASPSVTSNLITYTSPNAGIKQFMTNRAGIIRFIQDTKWEWRTGCNLCKKQIYGGTSQTPTYGSAYTNWPHFLVGQVLSNSYVPNTSAAKEARYIPLADRHTLTKYTSIKFSAKVRLLELSKSVAGNCPVGDWVPDTCNVDACTGGNCPLVDNHALFYFAFVLWRHNEQEGVPNVIYQVVPVIYTEDGVKYITDYIPPLQLDQYSDAVYFMPSYAYGASAPTNLIAFPRLVQNSQNALAVDTVRTIDIDVKKLSEQTLTKITQEKGLATALKPSDYYLSVFLAGWETWGGYKSDIVVSEMSLKGYKP